MSQVHFLVLFSLLSSVILLPVSDNGSKYHLSMSPTELISPVQISLLNSKLLHSMVYLTSLPRSLINDSNSALLKLNSQSFPFYFLTVYIICHHLSSIDDNNIFPYALAGNLGILGIIFYSFPCNSLQISETLLALPTCI